MADLDVDLAVLGRNVTTLEADAALKRVDAALTFVRDLHATENDDHSCRECVLLWPCPTARAVGAPATETEEKR